MQGNVTQGNSTIARITKCKSSKAPLSCPDFCHLNFMTLYVWTILTSFYRSRGECERGLSVSLFKTT